MSRLLAVAPIAVAAPLAAFSALQWDMRQIHDAPQLCTGGTGNNSWYGHGRVNALRAITNGRSQSG